MTTWRVLKLDGAKDAADDYATWEEVGSVETDYIYTPPSSQAVGEKYGAGSFLLLMEDGKVWAETTIVTSPPTYIEIDDAINEEVAA